MWFQNLRVATKQILGFGIIILFSVLLSITAFVSLRNVSGNYENLISFSEKRVQNILDINYNVMDIRRITTAINAYCGDAERQQGYKTESATVCQSVYDGADAYIELAKTDAALSEEECGALTAKAENLKTVLTQYKRDLIDPNIEFGIVGDKESLVANSAANSSLISTLQSTIVEMKEIEQELSEMFAEETRERSRGYQIVFVILTAVIVMLSVLLAFVISNSISKPIVSLAAFMRKAGETGDIVLTPENVESISSYSKAKDEIGNCIASSAQFIEHINKISRELANIADGDLSVRIDALSDKDVIAMAMQKMLDNLNAMFGEIRVASEQVSAGSGQVSQASQGLASGFSEQTASVGELSASLTQLQDKTDSNAQKSAKAQEANNATSEKLEDSIRSMGQMLSAMKEIDESSSSITKVIKVIDDIAFQTNILALNAAVEAARAGQHGKGFAVVADEVRNLAAKSAEAAKETSSLIEGSTERVKEGNAIVAKTNADLEAAVENARESTRLIEQVASESKEQAKSISEITRGMEQITSIVQESSATAEESASAAEEMSMQSIVMNDIVAQFKLRESSGHSFSAPAQISRQLPGRGHTGATELSVSGDKY